MGDILLQGDGTKATWTSASSEYSGAYASDKAFDGTFSGGSGDRWITNTSTVNLASPYVSTGWYQWDFQSSKTITQIRLGKCGYLGQYFFFPKDCTILTSSTGAFAGEESNAGEITFSHPGTNGTYSDWEDVPTPTAGQHLRIQIDNCYWNTNVGSSGWLALGEIELYELGWTNDTYHSLVSDGITLQTPNCFHEHYADQPTLTTNFTVHDAHHEHEPAQVLLLSDPPLQLLQGNLTDWPTAYFTASSVWSSSYDTYDAFDGVVGSAAWLSADADEPDGTNDTFWQIDVGTKMDFRAMRMASWNLSSHWTFPKEFRVFGSNTGDFTGEETLLLQDVTKDVGLYEWDDWRVFESHGEYRYYRVTIQSRWDRGQTSWTYVSIGEFEFYFDPWVDETYHTHVTDQINFFGVDETHHEQVADNVMLLPDTLELYQGDATKKEWMTHSTRFNSSYDSKEAFDGTLTGSGNCWISSAAGGPNVDGSCWNQVDFQEDMTMWAVRANRRVNSGSENYPDKVVVYGSATGAFSGEEVELGSGNFNDVAYGAMGWWVTLPQKGAYQYYRIQVHTMYKSGSNYNWVAVNEWEWYRDATTFLTVDETYHTLISDPIVYDVDESCYHDHVVDNIKLQLNVKPSDSFHTHGTDKLLAVDNEWQELIGDATRQYWASSSGQYSSYAPRYAFNGADGTDFIVDTTPGPNPAGTSWWQLTLPTAMEFTGFRFQNRSGSTYNHLWHFKVLGSNTGSFSGEETELLEEYGTFHGEGGWDSWYYFTSTGNFLYYRVQFLSMHYLGNPNEWLGFEEFEFKFDPFVNDSYHAHVADQVVLDIGAPLVCHGSDHLHVVDNVELGLNLSTTSETYHLHVADQINLIKQSTLAGINETFHAHVVDKISTILVYTLVVAETYHLHFADSTAVGEMLAVRDTHHYHLVRSEFTTNIVLRHILVWTLDSHSTYHELESDYFLRFIYESVQVNADLTIPFISMETSFGSRVTVGIPAIEVDGNIIVLNVLSGAFSIPMVTVDASMTHAIHLDGDFNIPSIEVTANFILNNNLSGSYTIPIIEADGSISFNNVIDGSIAIPMIMFSNTHIRAADPADEASSSIILKHSRW